MSRIAMAFVHHANQLLVTDGYLNRDGISPIIEGYRSVLRAHREYRIPAALHVSGTLVEAVAWHDPSFLTEIRDMVEEGTLTLLGGTYSEPIMTEMSTATNLRQIEVMAGLLERHLGVKDGALPTAWVPERVWQPGLRDVLTDADLPGGGFKRILLDDRLFAPMEPSAEDPEFCRAAVDRRSPCWWPNQIPPAYRCGSVDPRLLVPRVLDGERPLTVVPLSAHLRYLLPPRSGEQFDYLNAMVADLLAKAQDTDSVLLTFGDDVERAGGVAGWEPVGERYANALRWIAENELIRPVHLDNWLDARTVPAGPTPDAGSYYELEIGWRAGTDYQGWTGTDEWRPYQRILNDVEAAVQKARDTDADQGLVTVAERLLMLGQHETAWRDQVSGDPHGELAGWVKAGVSHSRLALPLIDAADWSTAGEARPSALIRDVDEDGEEELVLSSDDVWAVVSPRHGARLTLMAHRETGSGRPASLIAGNPCDHWNMQEEVHKFMETPAGHPGALTDPANPDLAWRPEIIRQTADSVLVDLQPLGSDSASGARRYGLLTGVPALLACVELPAEGTLENALIPDYLGVVLNGSGELQDIGGQSWRGWQWGDRKCWLAFATSEAKLVAPRWLSAGHSCAVSVAPHRRHLDLLIGGGEVNDLLVGQWLASARPLLHHSPVVPAKALTRAALSS